MRKKCVTYNITVTEPITFISFVKKILPGFYLAFLKFIKECCQRSLVICNYSSSFEIFSLLTKKSWRFVLELKESLLIIRDKPPSIHFMLLVSFYTPGKHQKTKGLLMFPGGIERDHGRILGRYRCILRCYWK